MDPAVQGDVLRDHLFQLVHNGLDGVSCCYGFVLVSCNGDLILRTADASASPKAPDKIQLPKLFTSGRKPKDKYLVLVILLRELNVHVMLCADIGDDGALAANNFGVILGVHSDGQLVTPESL